MLGRFRLFVRGLASHWLGAAGVVVTTSAFVGFAFLELLRLLGILTNAYLGLLTYLLFPALFVLGLLLIPLGWWRLRRRSGHSSRELLDQRFGAELVRPAGWGSKLFLIVAGLTLVNLLVLGAGSARMLRFMDQPVFCGTACHSVMGPEWTVYQDSPHAHVRCVDCHVGEGADALVDSKINGLWQMISISFDLYQRPIPTPVHNLRPARETCERCHWPDKFYGQRIKVIPRYALDRDSTPRYSTLALKVGSGAGQRRQEIHWHVAADNTVRYAARDRQRTQMLWVEVRQPDGSFRRYRNRRLASEETSPVEVRTLDCVDCHNRATHIYEEPEAAVDARIADGRIDRALPEIKAQALALLTASYPDQAAAMQRIAHGLRAFYTQRYPRETMGMGEAIEQAIEALQETYRRNVHHRMQVLWNAYPDHLGHRGEGGCFRCHGLDLVDAEGRAIPSDCTLCHSMLAFESAEPFRFLAPIDETDPERMLHQYLRDEFVRERPGAPRALEKP